MSGDTRKLVFGVFNLVKLLYCLCSKNKDTDQLCSYCTGGLQDACCWFPFAAALIFYRCGVVVVLRQDKHNYNRRNGKEKILKNTNIERYSVKLNDVFN